MAEAVGLSTCNRCELYMVGEDVGELREAAVRHLAGYAGGRTESLEPLLYVRRAPTPRSTCSPSPPAWTRWCRERPRSCRSSGAPT